MDKFTNESMYQITQIINEKLEKKEKITFEVLTQILHILVMQVKL